VTQDEFIAYEAERIGEVAVLALIEADLEPKVCKCTYDCPGWSWVHRDCPDEIARHHHGPCGYTAVAVLKRVGLSYT